MLPSYYLLSMRTWILDANHFVSAAVAVLVVVVVAVAVDCDL